MNDPEWTEYISKKSVDPDYYKHEQFFKIVMDDKADVTHWLKIEDFPFRITCSGMIFALTFMNSLEEA